MKNPLFSIITVTYNAELVLEKTIQSVLGQTAVNNIEYIIVDGKSKDGTLAIIQKYEDKIAKWVSEPDKGLYDAMNKALDMATGDYVWFINAGDEIYSPDTLQKIINNSTDADVYYGETEEVSNEGEVIGMRRLSVPKNLSWKSFNRGMLVCHQSIIIKRTLAGKYNALYKVAADIDWVITALKQSKKIVNTELVLSRFAKGGISGQNIQTALIERFKIMVRHYGLLPTLWNHIFISFNFAAYYIKHRRF